MPLERLYEYRGTNPRPADFDEYWESALNEMKAVDAKIELIPAEFQAPFAECYHMYFTGVKGARIHAKLIKPKNVQEKAPALLMFHGYTASSGDWIDKLPYAAAGFVVAALDCRGQSGKSEDVGGVKGTTIFGQFIRGLDGPKQDMLMRHIFLDAAQLAGLIMDMPEVDETRVCTMGGSQGGALGLVCAALEPRVSRIAVSSPFLSDYKRVWDMGLAKDAYEELRRYFRAFDPLHLREEEIFTRLGYIDVHHLAPRIRGEVLMGVSMMDHVCPPSTQFADYNMITSKKTARIYHDFEHEPLPGFTDEAFRFFLRK